MQTPSDRPLQERIDAAMARCFLYRYLALAFEDLDEPRWALLVSPAQRSCFRQAAAGVDATVAASASALGACLEATTLHGFRAACVAAFGHAARGQCPLNEIEYGDIKADPLFQPHRLADLAAFYRAFGVELCDSADERHDHLCLELEFMSVLAAKEAYALEHQLEADELMICLEAQRDFLRHHLGRWSPAFARRLAQATPCAALQLLGACIRQLVENDCHRFNVRAGSDDLLLRPIDESAETMCASCGLAAAMPGTASAHAPRFA